MANIEMTPHRPHGSEERHRARSAGRVAVGGSTAESLAGLGAVVLAILALIGVLPVTLTSIATIAIGAGLFLRGLAIVSHLNEIRHESHAMYSTRARGGRVGSLTIEMLGGLAVIALGILALIGFERSTLLPIAAIVFGGALMLSAGGMVRLAELSSWHPEVDPRAREVEREAARGTAGTESLIGIGAIVLGILSLVGVSPTFLLVVIANIAVGGALLMGGAMLGSRSARTTD